MKNLAMLLLCLFSISTFSFAQTADANDKVTKEDYQRYIDSKMEMDFRNMTLKALDLTSDEIIAFDPIFREYMNDKDRLFEKRMNLLEDFRDEMREDDSVKNQNEDRADFIEDYWETEIAEMELSKNYFDRLEDAIPVDKAIKFFLWEDAIQDQIVRNTMSEFVPMVLEFEYYPLNSDEKKRKDKARWKKDKKKDKWNSDKKDMSMKKEYKSKDKLTAKGSSSTSSTSTAMLSVETQKSLSTFNEWNKSNKGKVDISHEYTAAGLNALVTALDGVRTDMNLYLPSFDEKKKMIMNVAATIQKDPYSLKHADMIHKAFVGIGELMENVNQSNELTMIGKKINPDIMLTKQAPHIYNFFETANSQLQSLTKKMPMEKVNDSMRK
jgi:hypothetical protein